MPIINITKEQWHALDLLNKSSPFNGDCELCFIGDAETVKEDTSYVGDLIKTEKVKHYSKNAESLGYKNYKSLPKNLQDAVDILNNLGIKGPVPNKDGKIIEMPHIVGCITPTVSKILIKDGYGKKVLFKYKNNHLFIRIYMLDLANTVKIAGNVVLVAAALCILM